MTEGGVIDIYWNKAKFKEFIRQDSLKITFFRCPWIPCGAPLGKMSLFRRVFHLATNALVRSIHNRFVSLTRNCGSAYSTRSCQKQHHLFKSSEKTLWREKRSKSTFSLYSINTAGIFLLYRVCFILIPRNIQF